MPYERSRVLVIAATPRELAPSDGWHAVACGVGPIEAALTTTSAIRGLRPSVILHVGIAGARRAAALPAGTLVIGEASQYTDLSVPAEWAPGRVLPSPDLVTAARATLPDAMVRVIGTSGRVGGTVDCDVEAMEGFGVLRAAERAGIPALEVRAISNEIEEADRARWAFDAAFAAIVAATPRLVDAISAAAPTPSP
jgi:nucleoside phosphorylase